MSTIDEAAIGVSFTNKQWKRENHSEIGMDDHTPGPWTGIKNVNWPLNSIGQYVVFVDDSVGVAIADMGAHALGSMTVRQRVANSKLVAAAPSMREWILEKMWGVGGVCQDCGIIQDGGGRAFIDTVTRHKPTCKIAVMIDLPRET